MSKILLIHQPMRFYSRIAQKVIPHLPVCKRLFYQAIYKANPRTLDYCLESVLEIRKNDHLEVIALASQGEETRLAGMFKRFKTVRTSSDLLKEASRRVGDFDSVILLYPDAIGHGYDKIESIVLGSAKQVYILNGRKRLFELTGEMLKKLRIRRILEKCFILEISFAVIFPFISAPFFLYEYLTRGLCEGIIRDKPGTRGDTGVSDEFSLQESNATTIERYWADNPQTYGKEDGKTIYNDSKGVTINLDLGNKVFFNKVDETFYSWNKPLHRGEGDSLLPFAKIFDYKTYAGKEVLEIGCGMGTMAMNWARRGAHIWAVDLNTTSVHQTRNRFKIHGLPGTILQADARTLPFKDKSFDYIYSWGVLHHSPHMERSFREIHRVLNPGGKIGIMLYNRNSFLYWYLIKCIEGIVHIEDSFLSPVELSSRYGDGARAEGNPYTYPVTRREIIHHFMPQFQNVKIQIFGTDIDWMFSILCIPYHEVIPLFLKKSYARRFGWSMWIEAQRAS